MGANKFSSVDGNKKETRRLKRGREEMNGTTALNCDGDDVEKTEVVIQLIQGESPEEVDDKEKTDNHDNLSVVDLNQPIQGEPPEGADKEKSEDVGNRTVPNVEQLRKGAPLKGKSASNKRKIFVDLDNIHPHGFKWNVQARVQQKNPVFFIKNTKRLKMLLIDDKGTRMEACIQDRDVDKLEGQLHEGKVYSFFGVRAAYAPSDYKLADQRFECLLTKDTIIEEADDDHGVPDHSFDFKTFDKLGPFVGNKTLLIDTIGVVRYVSPIYYWKYNGKDIPKRDVTLVDKTLNHKRLIVSGSLATADEDEWDISSTYSTVIAATALLVNKSKVFWYRWGVQILS